MDKEELEKARKKAFSKNKHKSKKDEKQQTGFVNDIIDHDEGYKNNSNAQE